jgi:pyruvate formate lyase activating enzyme
MCSDPPLKATVWKIDRFAIHDGPGIRTSIYFKGCPLRCLWCSNPEGQHKRQELAFSDTKCIRCGLCSDACPRGALRLQDDGPVLDPAKCDLCGACQSSCPTGALFVYGRLYALPEIADVIERDRHAYRQSGGGITCTGGEPLLQPGFLKRLLARCRAVGVHAALETCGYSGRAEFRKVLDEIDWLFFDLKHADDTHHRRLTGRSNSLILDNLRTASSVLGESKKTLIIRQVVVPGFNDGSNIRALAELASGLPHVTKVELLPYHAYGMHKYRTLWRMYRLKDVGPPEEGKLNEARETIERFGIHCEIAGL